MRPTKHELFMKIAWAASERSHCRKLHVGCVITDWDGEQMAIGYNGLAKKMGDDCGVSQGKCDCIHAEANAVVKVRFGGRKIAYCTYAPCRTCAALLVNAGVELVVWDQLATKKSREGLDLLEGAQIASLAIWGSAGKTWKPS